MPGAWRPRGHNRLTGQDSNLCRVKLEKLDFWMLLEHDFFLQWTALDTVSRREEEKPS